MTGGHSFNPRRLGERWTISENVDVIAVDIFRQSTSFKLHRLEDLRSLENFCRSDFGSDVALRLFLVEDMTAVVVETLGSAFALTPHLFNCHMKHTGHVQLGSVGEPFPETEQPFSRFRDPEFFTLAFRRRFEDHEIFKSGPRQRHTMYRDHDTETFTLEERVSGMICNHQSSCSRIGALPCFILLPCSRVISGPC
jgi:hypothetical protein